MSVALKSAPFRRPLHSGWRATVKLSTMLGFMALLTLAAPGAAQTQSAGIVALNSDQAVIIHFDAQPTGVVALDSRGAATLSELDMMLVRQFSEPANEAAASGSHALQVRSPSALPEPAPLTPNAIRIVFARVGSRSVLIVENGYERGLVYRARIQRGSEARPTDVCLVMPARRGYESWDYPLDRIEISDIRLVPWLVGDPIPCA